MSSEFLFLPTTGVMPPANYAFYNSFHSDLPEQGNVGSLSDPHCFACYRKYTSNLVPLEDPYQRMKSYGSATTNDSIGVDSHPVTSLITNMGPARCLQGSQTYIPPTGWMNSPLNDKAAENEPPAHTLGTISPDGRYHDNEAIPSHALKDDAIAVSGRNDAPVLPATVDSTTHYFDRRDNTNTWTILKELPVMESEVAETKLDASFSADVGSTSCVLNSLSKTVLEAEALAAVSGDAKKPGSQSPVPSEDAMTCVATPRDGPQEVNPETQTTSLKSMIDSSVEAPAPQDIVEYLAPSDDSLTADVQDGSSVICRTALPNRKRGHSDPAELVGLSPLQKRPQVHRRVRRRQTNRLPRLKNGKIVFCIVTGLLEKNGREYDWHSGVWKCSTGDVWTEPISCRDLKYLTVRPIQDGWSFHLYPTSDGLDMEGIDGDYKLSTPQSEVMETFNRDDYRGIGYII